jgi:hypothetical protein
MAIKAKVIVVGGKKFHAEPEAKREPEKRSSPQEQVKTAEPEKRLPPVRIEHDAPQDVVEILGEPRLVGTRNSFILKSSSKFHRDMIDDENN